jgi:hypothetical protein
VENPGRSTPTWHNQPGGTMCYQCCYATILPHTLDHQDPRTPTNPSSEIESGQIHHRRGPTHIRSPTLDLSTINQNKCPGRGRNSRQDSNTHTRGPRENTPHYPIRPGNIDLLESTKMPYMELLTGGWRYKYLHFPDQQSISERTKNNQQHDIPKRLGPSEMPVIQRKKDRHPSHPESSSGASVHRATLMHVWIGEQKTGTHHTLKAVVVPLFTELPLCNKGHYVVYIQSANSRNWSLFDDQTVRWVQEEEVLHQEAALLIYSRQSPPTLFDENKTNQQIMDRLDSPNPMISRQQQGRDITSSISPGKDEKHSTHQVSLPPTRVGTEQGAHASSYDCMPFCSCMSACGIHQQEPGQRASYDLPYARS